MKKTLFLWLLAAAAILTLVVLLMRPPAWATAPPGAVYLGPDMAAQPHAAPAQITAGAPAAMQVELQANTPSSDNCIACHTDKKKLKKLAKEPEEVKSEASSGEG